jgi:hypothetical protein
MESVGHASHHMGHDGGSSVTQGDNGERTTVVLHTGGLNWASEKAVVEAVLGP